MDHALLNRKIEESGITKVYLAKKLGITPQGLYNKLSGIYDWRRSEVETLCEVLHIDDADERSRIFFANKSE